MLSSSSYIDIEYISQNILIILTIEFAHGMNMPSVNIPNTGPPTIPNIPNAA